MKTSYCRPLKPKNTTNADDGFRPNGWKNGDFVFVFGFVVSLRVIFYNTFFQTKYRIRYNNDVNFTFVSRQNEDNVL